MVGGKLKETRITHWMELNTDTNNSSGFTALPAGRSSKDGIYSLMGEQGCFWDMTIDNPDDAMHWDVFFNSAHAGFTKDSRNVGYSVRCL